MGPLDRHVIASDALRAAPSGFTLAVRTPWYRSLPLISVVGLRVAVDATELSIDKAVLRLGDARFHPSELPRLHDTWWFMLDDLVAEFDIGHPMTSGVRYDVRVSMDLRIPYLLVGPDQTPLVTKGSYCTALRCL